MSKKILSSEGSNSDAFTDLLFNALLGFAFMFFISFALIQKPQDGGKIDSKAEFIISAEWEDHHPDDVDLIVEDPEGNIVYFQLFLLFLFVILVLLIHMLAESFHYYLAHL